MDGVNDTLDGAHMWLTPILPGEYGIPRNGTKRVSVFTIEKASARILNLRKIFSCFSRTKQSTSTVQAVLNHCVLQIKQQSKQSEHASERVSKRSVPITVQSEPHYFLTSRYHAAHLRDLRRASNGFDD